MTIFAPTLKVSIMDNLQKSFLGFVLQTKKTNGMATLYKRVKLPNGSNVWISSQIKIPVDSFYSKAKFNAWSNTGDYTRLMEVDSAIKTMVKSEITDTSIYKDAITKIVHKEEYERQKEEKEELARIEREKKENEKKDVLLFLHNFINGISEGTILQHDGKPYSSSTVSNYKTFEKILGRFHRKHKFDFSSINKEINDRFISFCRKEGLMDKTINKNLICFRKLVNYAVEEKDMELKASALKAFSEIRVDDSSKRAEIYLPDSVINAMYSMKLTGVKEIARDLFFVGCRSCLRFSDFSRLDKNSFKTTREGIVIDLTQQKTGGRVVIPVLDGNIIKVMEKYGYQLPQLTEQVLNSNIKEICRELASLVTSLNEKEITMLTAHERRQEQTYMKNHEGKLFFERDSKGNVVKPRWQLVSSHTARRSGITNLYLTHKLSIYEMMSISGHQSEKVFLKYIKLSKYEKAFEILRIMNAQ